MNVFRILGEFHPCHYSKECVKTGFGNFLESFNLNCCTDYDVEVRDPEENTRCLEQFLSCRYSDLGVGIDVDGWHLDGVNYPPRGYSVIWANEFPTECRHVDTLAPFPLREYEVAIIDNDVVEHRMPLHVGNNRWFARYMIEDQTRYSYLTPLHSWERHKFLAESLLK